MNLEVPHTCHVNIGHKQIKIGLPTNFGCQGGPGCQKWSRYFNLLLALLIFLQHVVNKLSTQRLRRVHAYTSLQIHSHVLLQYSYVNHVRIKR